VSPTTIEVSAAKARHRTGFENLRPTIVKTLIAPVLAIGHCRFDIHNRYLFVVNELENQLNSNYF
jgi:hypothetical protein